MLKICKNCNKLIQPDEELFKQNPYLQSNFRLKVFCSKECRVEYNNNLKKKKYVLRETEHNKNVYAINKLLNGEVNLSKNKDHYNPDITKENTEFEVELFRKIVHLRHKAKKWDSSKKHMLIVCISQQSMNLFDKVMFFNNGELIKVK